MRRTLFEADHEAFRDSFRRFLDKEVAPHQDEWNAAGIVPRELFSQAGEHGFLGFAAPEEFGGGGTRDFRFNVIINEEIQRAGVASASQGLTLQTDVTLPCYLDLATPEQHAQDTAELSFTDVRVPVENLLGEEGQGFKHLVRNLPQERLGIATNALAGAAAALEITLAYVKERKAFGKPIGSFQNSKFVLAELATEVSIGQQYLDNCVTAHNAGELTAEEASMAKWWCTELQGRAVDKGVQLHGGYGFMNEYAITRAYADARITRIYGGTTEIMKEVIGRSLGL
jgi:alkylation response protein AidB-like acyl-CoA dehydrogenase